MRTMCAEQGPCSKKHASPLWDALSWACRCYPPHFCWNLAPHPLPSACHRDRGEWIHSKGSRQSLLLNWTLRELGPTAGFMHQKKKKNSPGCSALGFMKITTINATNILVHQSVQLILVWVLHLSLKISSKTKNDVWVWRRFLLFCHYTRQMNTQWCGYITMSTAI